MPGVLADTHALVWYLLDDARLSTRARDAIRQTAAQEQTIGVSSASIVELVYLTEKNRLPVGALEIALQRLHYQPWLFETVPVSLDIAIAVGSVSRQSVPDFPDRIIAATALYLGTPLISRDRKIRLSVVETIW